MAQKIAPSKSTVYVGNLPFSLTNNDLHKLFSHHGKIARITIQKDRVTRQSKGIAFLLFVDRQAALSCVQEHNDSEIGGRKVKCSLARDNGRTTEFMKRKEYSDKNRCFECGESGHLSYTCRKNLLGDRNPPKKKKKKKKMMMGSSLSKNAAGEEDEEEEDEEEKGFDDDDETLSAAIAFQRVKENCEKTHRQAAETSKKVYVKDVYFSDEEHLQ